VTWTTKSRSDIGPNDRSRVIIEGPISPPLSSSTPLASLDGWNLVLRCATCGPREKPVSELYKAVRASTALGVVLPKLRCDGCRAKPAGLEATCPWARRWNPEAATWRLDLIPLLPAHREAA
jgi:hypothetical protein